MNKQQAFTLVELMVTVAIVGILAAIAIPNYQESVKKSRRADAEGALLGLANAMERRFTETKAIAMPEARMEPTFVEQQAPMILALHRSILHRVLPQEAQPTT